MMLSRKALNVQARASKKGTTAKVRLSASDKAVEHA
jgi:hypothetical protein